MQRTQTITFDENDSAKDVTVKEFSVAEINDLVEDMITMKYSSIDIIFPDRMERLPAEIVARSACLTMDELAMFSPTRLEKIYDVVEKLNPFFFLLIDRMIKASKEDSIEKPSTLPAAG